MYRGRGRVHTGFWWKKPGKKSYLEDLGLDRRIILNRTLNNHGGKRKETTKKTLV